jgi:hypothetical protein
MSQKYKVVYTIPYSSDSEIRETVFEEEIISTDSTGARKAVYKKHHNAQIQELTPIRY